MDLSKYAALFLAESREHLTACNSSLLEWERDPSAVEPVDRLFRAIHTIKGMAATMGYAPVAGCDRVRELGVADVHPGSGSKPGGGTRQPRRACRHRRHGSSRV